MHTFPAPVSLKKVLNESSPPPMVLSDGICIYLNINISRCVRTYLSIWLNAVLKAVELPAGVSDLDSGLADVYTDAFSHI